MFLPTILFALAAPILAHAPRGLSASDSSQLHHARSVCARKVHCVLAHEAVEGPFYVQHPLIRSNISEDRPGISLSLSIEVVDVKTCEPVKGVYVDIWHADAMGEYSGWASERLLSAQFIDVGTDVSAMGTPVEDSRWLRGVQPTPKNGTVKFETVWPGWYAGRATHIHLRIHTGNITLDHGVFLGGSRTSHTGQFFFADQLVKRVSRTIEPYKSRLSALKPTLNDDDGIYVDSKGGEQIVDITQKSDENGDIAFVGTVTVGIDMEADHHEDHRRPPPWGRHPRGHAKGVLWGFLGVALLVAMIWCVRLYWKRRRAAMGYTEVQREEQESLRRAGERTQSYGAT
jgi:protocatechuate 3,4-dioxygenase beta subunit